MAATAVSVGTSATLVVEGTASAGNPNEVIITNDSGNTVYFGSDDTVTSSNGLTVATGSSLGLQLTEGRDVYAIAGTTSEVRVCSWA